MHSLRILYHHRTQGRGAEGNHIVSIVTALREAGHVVDVLSPPGVDPFNATITVPVDASKANSGGWGAVWRWISLHLPGALFELAEIAYNLPAYFRLRRALRTQRYDVVFERYASYLVAGALAAHRHGCRFVLEVNDVSGVADRVRPQYFPRLCALAERHILARCDVAHAVSSYLGERLEELGVESGRVVVAPNGFDVRRMARQRSRDDMRARFGFDDSVVVVGFAGWFVPWDRLDFLLDVFGEVWRSTPCVRLCLVGDGEPARELMARIRGTPLEAAVVLTGAVPRQEVYDYIQMFDIGILPHSNLFGSPVVMFEMMGLDVPMVVPALPPIRDVHGGGEVTALLFKPLDRKDCVRQLGRLAASSELRATIGRAARAALDHAHTWNHTARRILAAIESAPPLSESAAGGIRRPGDLP